MILVGQSFLKACFKILVECHRIKYVRVRAENLTFNALGNKKGDMSFNVVTQIILTALVSLDFLNMTDWLSHTHILTFYIIK